MPSLGSGDERAAGQLRAAVGDVPDERDAGLPVGRHDIVLEEVGSSRR
jgi:hypothetical protein